MLKQRVLQGVALAHAGKALVFGTLNAAFDAGMEERLTEMSATKKVHASNLNGLRHFCLPNRGYQQIT